VQLRTSTKDNDANPTWNESFKLLVHDVEAQVHFILPPPNPALPHPTLFPSPFMFPKAVRRILAAFHCIDAGFSDVFQHS